METVQGLGVAAAFGMGFAVLLFLSPWAGIAMILITTVVIMLQPS